LPSSEDIDSLKPIFSKMNNLDTVIFDFENTEMSDRYSNILKQLLQNFKESNLRKLKISVECCESDEIALDPFLINFWPHIKNISSLQSLSIEQFTDPVSNIIVGELGNSSLALQSLTLGETELVGEMTDTIAKFIMTSLSIKKIRLKGTNTSLQNIQTIVTAVGENVSFRKCKIDDLCSDNYNGDEEKISNLIENNDKLILRA
jgi:hypothetical protein